jgi:hypothetical protein
MNLPAKEIETEEEKGVLTTRDKVLYGALALAGVATAVVLGGRFIKNKIADKSQAKSFEEGTPETLAKQIKMAFENDGYFGTDTKALRAVLTRIKSKTELDKVFKAYQKQFNSNMYRDMSSELQSTEYNEMLQIMAGKPDRPGQKPTAVQFKAWAKRLKAAFDKTYSFLPGTDEEAIRAVLVEIPSQAAFIGTGKAYYLEYNTHLLPDLKSELSPSDYYASLKIITDKPKG